MSNETMKLWSWNVNGLRAAVRKGFLDWLQNGSGEIVCLQETRARPDQLTRKAREPEGWSTHFVAATSKKGYSGVGLYSRIEPDNVDTSLGEERFDVEGRLQLARFGELLVANVYFPNGSGTNRDHSRVPYKLSFYRKLYDLLEEEKEAGRRILVVGDYNTAHRPVDLARPKQNKKTSGFLPRERKELDRWLDNGWTDTFRHFYPDEEEVYSWWSQRKGVRERNVGWRIDYVLASEGAMEYVQDAHIATEIMGSDHCPVGVTLDPAILK